MKNGHIPGSLYLKNERENKHKRNAFRQVYSSFTIFCLSFFVRVSTLNSIFSQGIKKQTFNRLMNERLKLHNKQKIKINIVETGTALLLFCQIVCAFFQVCFYLKEILSNMMQRNDW